MEIQRANGNGLVWRATKVRKLVVGENGGRHVCLVDVYDQYGKPLRHHPAVRIGWGWDGQRADEKVEPRPLDKPQGEPMGNVDIYKNMHLRVWVDGEGIPSDIVTGLRTDLPDEGPDVTWGHHSYYVEFRLQVTAPVPQPKPEPKPEEPKEPNVPVDRERLEAIAAEIVAYWRSKAPEVIASEVTELLLRKNADYGDAWRVTGVIGILVRMMDKALRLETLADGRKALVVDEGVADTFLDAAGYAMLGLFAARTGAYVPNKEAKG